MQNYALLTCQPVDNLLRSLFKTMQYFLKSVALLLNNFTMHITFNALKTHCIAIECKHSLVNLSTTFNSARSHLKATFFNTFTQCFATLALVVLLRWMHLFHYALISNFYTVTTKTIWFRVGKWCVLISVCVALLPIQKLLWWTNLVLVLVTTWEPDFWIWWVPK